MSRENKRLIIFLSIILTILLLAFTIFAIIFSINKARTQMFRTGDVIDYELLLVFVSAFGGVIISYLLFKAGFFTKKIDHSLSNLLKENHGVKDFFHSMQNFCHMGLLEIDTSFNIIFANDIARLIFSSKEPDILYMSLRTIISKEDLSNADLSAIFNGEREHARFMMKLKEQNGASGGAAAVRGIVKPIPDSRGKIGKAQILLIDVSDAQSKSIQISELEERMVAASKESSEKVEDLLKANEKLRKSVRILSDTFTAAPTGLIVLDSDGNIANLNRSAENLFNFSEKNIIGKNIDTLLSSRDFKKNFLHKAKDGENVEGEVDCLKNDLTHFIGMIMVKPIFDEKHDVLRYVLAVNDITRRAKFEKVLLLRNQELLSIIDIFISTNKFHELDKKLNMFLEKLFDNLEIMRRGLIYLNSDNGILELTIYKGFHFTMLKDLQRIHTKGTLCGYAFESGDVVLSEMPPEEVAGEMLDELMECGISNNHVYIPIVYENEPLGILIIFPSKNYNYDMNDLKFFQMISEELGVCIKQAKHYDELKKKVEELLSVVKSKKRSDHAKLEAK